MKTPSPNPITIDQARRVLEVVDAGLSSGLGIPSPGHMCVEAAVCYALGLPHSDDPKCELPALRQYNIRINDGFSGTHKERAKLLRRLAIAQLGSDVLDGSVFIRLLAVRTVSVIIIPALKSCGIDTTACEAATTLEEAKKAARDARDAAKAAGSTAYIANAAYAAAAAQAAAQAANAAHADYASGTAVAVAADAAVAVAAFHLACETVIGILREMNAPGIALMDQLCPLPDNN